MNEKSAVALNREAGYIGVDGARVFSWLHLRADRRRQGTAVVICPPIGIDYMNSHRALRHIADEFARAGIPALRFDYPGSGDSDEVDAEADLWQLQLDSIGVAVQALRSETGCHSIGLFGFKMGASLAASYCRDHRCEFLALWAPVARGKRYLREIRLLQEMNLEQDKGAELEAAGLLINGATERALAALDLRSIKPDCGYSLLIPADEVDNEDELCEAWHSQGCDVRQLSLSGSAGMLVDAHFTQVPHAAIHKLVRESLPPARPWEFLPTVRPRLRETDVASDTAGSSVRESVHAAPDAGLFLVSSRSASPGAGLPLIVFLNSGANHHPGPNRIYVTLCRRLAGLGFPCLRVDLPGLGDGFVDDFECENITYLPNLAKHIDRVIADALQRDPGRRVVIAGLCSGAYGAFVSAIELAQRNIVEAILINPLTFYWEQGMSLEVAPSRDYQNWNWYMHSLRRGDKWHKLIRGDVDFGKLTSTLVKGVELKASGLLNRYFPSRPLVGHKGISGHLPTDLARILKNEVQLTLFLADSDPGLNILMTNAGDSVKQMIKHNTLSAYLIENADHTFSMRDSRERVTTLIVEHLQHAYLDPEQEIT